MGCLRYGCVLSVSVEAGWDKGDGSPDATEGVEPPGFGRQVIRNLGPIRVDFPNKGRTFRGREHIEVDEFTAVVHGLLEDLDLDPYLLAALFAAVSIVQMEVDEATDDRLPDLFIGGSVRRHLALRRERAGDRNDDPFGQQLAFHHVIRRQRLRHVVHLSSPLFQPGMGCSG